MSKPSLSEVVDRLLEQSSISDDLSRNLLRAYIASLDLRDLPEVYVNLVGVNVQASRLVAWRFEKLLVNRHEEALADQFAQRLILLKRDQRQLLPRINVVLSMLFTHASPTLKRSILDSFQDDGRKDSMSRWLKAILNDPMFFDSNESLRYWHASGDARVAKALAYQAPPEVVADALPSIVDGCDEGWIVARAAIRTDERRPEVLDAIREKFPASFAYVYAMTGRRLEQDDAVELVMSIEPDTFGDNSRGLAIWAIGQMGMWETLERIRELAPEIRRQDTENAARLFRLVDETAPSDDVDTPP